MVLKTAGSPRTASLMPGSCLTRLGINAVMHDGKGAIARRVSGSAIWVQMSRTIHVADMPSATR